MAGSLTILSPVSGGGIPVYIDIIDSYLGADVPTLSWLPDRAIRFKLERGQITLQVLNIMVSVSINGEPAQLDDASRCTVHLGDELTISVGVNTATYILSKTEARPPPTPFTYTASQWSSYSSIIAATPPSHDPHLFSLPMPRFPSKQPEPAKRSRRHNASVTEVAPTVDSKNILRQFRVWGRCMDVADLFPPPSEQNTTAMTSIECLTPAGTEQFIAFTKQISPSLVSDNRISCTGHQMMTLVTYITVLTIEDCMVRNIPLELPATQVEKLLAFISTRVHGVDAGAADFLRFLYSRGTRMLPPMPDHPDDVRLTAGPPVSCGLAHLVGVMQLLNPSNQNAQLIGTLTLHGPRGDADESSFAMRAFNPVHPGLGRHLTSKCSCLSEYRGQRRSDDRILLEQTEKITKPVDPQLLLPDPLVGPDLGTPDVSGTVAGALLGHAWDLGMVSPESLSSHQTGTVMSLLRLLVSQASRQRAIKAVLSEYFSGEHFSEGTATLAGFQGQFNGRNVIKVSDKALDTIEGHLAWAADSSAAKLIVSMIRLRRVMTGVSKSPSLDTVAQSHGAVIAQFIDAHGVDRLPDIAISDVALILDTALQHSQLANHTVDATGRVITELSIRPTLGGRSWLGALYGNLCMAIPQDPALFFSAMQCIVSSVSGSGIKPWAAGVALTALASHPDPHPALLQTCLLWIYERTPRLLTDQRADRVVTAQLLAVLARVSLKSAGSGPLGSILELNPPRGAKLEGPIASFREDLCVLIYETCMGLVTDSELGTGNIETIARANPVTKLMVRPGGRNTLPTLRPSVTDISFGDFALEMAPFLATVKATAYSRMMKSSSTHTMALVTSQCPDGASHPSTVKLVEMINDTVKFGYLAEKWGLNLHRSVSIRLRNALGATADGLWGAVSASVEDLVAAIKNPAPTTTPDAAACTALLATTAQGMLINGFALDRQRGKEHIPVAFLEQALRTTPANPVVWLLYTAAMLHGSAEYDEDTTQAYPLLSANWKGGVPPEPPTNAADMLTWGMHGTIRGVYKSTFIAAVTNALGSPAGFSAQILLISTVLFKVQKLMKTAAHQMIIHAHRTPMTLAQYAKAIIPTFVAHVVFHCPSPSGSHDHVTGVPGMLEQYKVFTQLALKRLIDMRNRWVNSTMSMPEVISVNALQSYMYADTQSIVGSAVGSLRAGVAVTEALKNSASYIKDSCERPTELSAAMFRVAFRPTLLPHTDTSTYTGPDLGLLFSRMGHGDPHQVLRLGYWAIMFMGTAHGLTDRVEAMQATAAELWRGLEPYSIPQSTMSISRMIVSNLRIQSNHVVSKISGVIYGIVHYLMAIISAAITDDFTLLFQHFEMAEMTFSETIERHYLALACNSAFIIVLMLASTGDEECLVRSRYIMAILHYLIQTRYDRATKLTTKHRESCQQLYRAAVEALDSGVHAHLPSASDEWRSMARAYHAESMSGIRSAVGFAYDMPRTTILAQAYVASLEATRDTERLTAVLQKVGKERTLFSQGYLTTEVIQSAIDAIRQDSYE
ncbi:hypothetical protein J8273_2728 [Carpediemonas membranifera]|uniref:Uncharacterized protein n=1 Tax=Carpediemonas membranifera TaxID=201153 RepID=A0A8J6E3N3_9EUKA|nr:hypothetical protein J8273_2728 [Carpediemonas membranifera]|eukprot:KAG9395816.1 hypothetical protein J8273_2728 [Carpediemonas membranifera]